MTDINHATTYEPAYGWDWDETWGGAVDLVSGYDYPVLRWLAQNLYDNFYVKTDGDDRESGASWADAWKTINLAMETVIDSKTIHIGFDTVTEWYNNEPADNKLSPDAANVIVIYETPVTGGGTGYSTVEVN